MLIPFAAIIVVAVGGMIFWSNPGRTVNRVAFTCSLHIAIWLGLLYAAVSDHVHGLWWMKCACAVSAAVPFHFWLVKEFVAATVDVHDRRWRLKVLGWMLLSGALAGIVFTEHFIPSHSTGERRVYGWGYYGYMFAVSGAYALVLQDAYKGTRRLTGGRRLELQVWLGGGCAMAAAILALMLVNSVTHDRRFVQLQPLAVLIFYGGTIVAITMQRIFDARQILRICMEKALLVALVATLAYAVNYLATMLLPTPFDFGLTAAAGVWAAIYLNERLDRLFQFYPEATTARQATFTAAQRQGRVETLEKHFCGVLQGWGQSDHALILTGAKDSFTGSGVHVSAESAVPSALRQLRWATPERLARERATEERKAVLRLLTEQELGVLVMVDGPNLSALIGVGVPASRRPYTYPQVTQLMELASIMESALERAHFSAKAQHAEQLATVGLLGASLAHEIRNPLVTIKSFVQLLPKHHSDAAFREKFFRLIGDEVSRIDQLTEQLLEMASPRSYAAQIIELHPVLRASLDLVATKAAHRNVQLLTEFSAEPDHVFTDASAAKQVMLNLCFNALQAVETREDDHRWVKIATRNLGKGVEMAVVDNGPGIAPEIRSRLFQPFQTTKSTGFGLGLAICNDILTNLNASLTVDPPAPGQGATFRVVFPCQPSSS